jgi:hypothetical protein
MSEKKQTSYKVLMGLILLMFALQTIHNICDWYQTWLGFIYYSNLPGQALDALEENSQASHSIYIIASMENLLDSNQLLHHHIPRADVATGTESAAPGLVKKFSRFLPHIIPP